MNCREFESLLADKLGGELGAADRPAFDAHLEVCAACRAEYDAHRATLERLKESVPGPTRAAITREGDRVLISTESQTSGRDRATLRFSSAILRYAAVILLSFVAGYLAGAFDRDGSADQQVESKTIVADGRQSPASVDSVSGDDGDADSIRRAVLVAHRSNPSLSDASKFMAAIFAERR